MISQISADRSTTFRMKRSGVLLNGFTTDIDADVAADLAELDALLAKRVLEPEDVGKGVLVSTAAPRRLIEVERLLKAPLTPKRVSDDVTKVGWAQHSLCDQLNGAVATDLGHSLADHIDYVSELSQLKYAIKSRLSDGWYGLDANARAVLEGHPSIQDYLVARAYHVTGLRDADGVLNHLLGNRAGVRRVVDYVAVSAARTVIDREKRRVPKYNEDDGAFVARLKAQPVSLSTAGFDATLKSAIDDLVFNVSASELIDHANIGAIPASLRPQLIRLIQNSPIPITTGNVDKFLPLFVTRALGYGAFGALDTEDEKAPTDADTFRVQFQDHADTALDVDRVALHCAAQLFHGMVVGDELGVFDVVNYLAHRRMLTRGGMQIRDKRLRNDLQRYIFANKFINLETMAEEDRTRPEERKMFARAVFEEGEGRLIDGMQGNGEFRQLWKVLVLEVARYLDRAQASFDPASFVSKQNVMQAVEDLQYNLSTNCIGIVPVIAPAIDAELNFVLTRILQHPEIAQQVSPAGGTWRRVVDKLNSEQMKPIPAAATLYAKAKLGEAILLSIADYTPAAFEDDKTFSAFVGQVDAYITTESKLQKKPATRAADDGQHEEDSRPPAPDETEAADSPAGASPSDDWDF